MQAYNPQLRKYFDNPVNVGQISVQSEELFVGRGRAGQAGRGNVIVIHFLTDAAQKIIDAKFQAYGCGVAIAASARLAELLLGLSVQQAQLLQFNQLIEFFQLGPKKYHCALLAEEALQAALRDWHSKNDFNDER